MGDDVLRKKVSIGEMQEKLAERKRKEKAYHLEMAERAERVIEQLCDS